MGLYDCRCMITGVSLKGAGAALVPLQASGDDHGAIALAIKGNFNRLGSIDGIKEDANTKLVLRFFLDGLQTGAFIVDEEYVRARECYPIATIEALLQAFERNMNDHSRAAVLGQHPVVFALISRSVWDTIARSSSVPQAPAIAELHELFEACSVPELIYSGSFAELSGQFAEFASVRAFLRGRGLAWKPADDPGQDYAEDMRKYLAEATQAFSDSPVILAGLQAYEHEVRDLLHDDRRLT
jgi:hypothetical protein